MHEGPHETDSTLDWGDLLACVLYLGIGLTSLTLAFMASSRTDRERDVVELVQLAAADGARPAELLIAGTQLEEVVFANAPILGDLTGFSPRLVPADTPVSVNHDRYWVVSSVATMLKTPKRYEGRELRREKGLKLLEWQSKDESKALQLSDRVDSATAVYVSETKDKPDIPCTQWRFGRLYCGPNSWNWVGLANVTVQGKSEPCVWAHPLAGYELRVTLPKLHLQGQLKGRYALADLAVSGGEVSPVTFRVLLDGEEKVKRVLPSRKGWNPFALTRDAGAPEVVDITFTVSSPDDGRRHFCFDGELVPMPAAKAVDSRSKALVGPNAAAKEAKTPR
ncbi:MAG: hypothetical protein CO108_28870 [Deltaproteobacteria bacterium CG_4_9_14_3_um_filter_63_12]|nr:MAG: hypothetical protein CO108_28870 [Deltaproteobacteria bacterium CG_4_9_14_3_um_filter_63_12]